MPRVTKLRATRAQSLGTPWLFMGPWNVSPGQWERRTGPPNGVQGGRAGIQGPGCHREGDEFSGPARQFHSPGHILSQLPGIWQHQ